MDEMVVKKLHMPDLQLLQVSLDGSNNAIEVFMLIELSRNLCQNFRLEVSGLGQRVESMYIC